MYFEDEKDIIGDNDSLHIEDDGSVSWEDILSDSAEEDEPDLDLDAVDEDTQAPAPNETQTYADSSDSGDDELNMADIDYGDSEPVSTSDDFSEDT